MCCHVLFKDSLNFIPQIVTAFAQECLEECLDIMRLPIYLDFAPHSSAIEINNNKDPQYRTKASKWNDGMK